MFRGARGRPFTLSRSLCGNRADKYYSASRPTRLVAAGACATCSCHDDVALASMSRCSTVGLLRARPMKKRSLRCAFGIVEHQAGGLMHRAKGRGSTSTRSDIQRMAFGSDASSTRNSGTRSPISIIAVPGGRPHPSERRPASTPVCTGRRQMCVISPRLAHVAGATCESHLCENRSLTEELLRRRDGPASRPRTFLSFSSVSRWAMVIAHSAPVDRSQRRARWPRGCPPGADFRRFCTRFLALELRLRRWMMMRHDGYKTLHPPRAGGSPCSLPSPAGVFGETARRSGQRGHHLMLRTVVRTESARGYARRAAQPGSTMEAFAPLRGCSGPTENFVSTR